jgi:hypothetical protein
MLLEKLLLATINFFTDADYLVWFANFKTFLKYFTLVSGVAFVFVLFKIRGLIKSQVAELAIDISPPEEAIASYDLRWEEIKKHVSSFTEAEWKLAVIEADKFVDDALKTAGFPGETMGERLMLIQPGQLLALQDLWDAHKLRNLLVHDANYQINHRQAILAIEAFERVLRELGALS